jgi:hypothetical protein
MALFVNQLDAVDPSGASGRTSYFMHQFEQDGGVHVHSQAPPWLDSKMQHNETFVGQADEHSDSQRSADRRDREQCLHALNVPHADAQAAALLTNLGHTIGLDGLLNSRAHAVLIDVEE